MHEEHDGSSGFTVEEMITIVSDDTINHADGDETTWIPDNGATYMLHLLKTLHKLYVGRF
jgi:hypothetical protein